MKLQTYMEYFLERKINKKRPKGMPKWKWHEQLNKEEISKEKLIQKEEKESSKIFTSEEKRKLRKESKFAVLALLFALLPLILLAIFILVCIIKGSCPNIGQSMPSEYECRQDPLIPECQEIYYSNPLR